MSRDKTSVSRRQFLGTVAAASVAASAARAAQPAAANSLVVHADQGRETISRHIYGHFSEHLGRCIYGGYWVGENSPIPNTRGIRNDVVEALRKIQIPNLRWPGGCFADNYHWMDGIGPRERRPAIVNTNWGGVVENNHFGTHEFMDLCGQLGTEPYICGNVGSGTVLEMQQWVEYLTADGGPMAELRRRNGRDKPWQIKFWGVGNENWGCGGRMRPEYYADVYRRYSTFVRDFGENRLYRVACGPSGPNYAWTEVLMREAAPQMQGLALHYYTSLRGPEGGRTGSATQFGEPEWFAVMKKTLVMDELVRNHAAIMDKYDRRNRVGLAVDEWGTWYNVEPGTEPRFLYQQNSLRDALVAGINLNIFNNHCDRVKLACIAQTVNVLQAMILTENEKMVLTPSYHVYEMYKVHHEATLLPVTVNGGEYRFGGDAVPALNVSASRDSSGKIHVSLCHLDPRQPAEVRCQLKGVKSSRISGRVLTAPEITAHNTFENPNAVAPTEFRDARLEADGFSATIPAKSVVVLELG